MSDDKNNDENLVTVDFRKAARLEARAKDAGFQSLVRQMSEALAVGDTEMVQALALKAQLAEKHGTPLAVVKAGRKAKGPCPELMAKYASYREGYHAEIGRRLLERQEGRGRSEANEMAALGRAVGVGPRMWTAHQRSQVFCELEEGWFDHLKSGGWVYLVGPPGTGKTTTALAMLIAWCRHGHQRRARYATQSGVIEDLKFKGAGESRGTAKAYEDIPLLVVDEFAIEDMTSKQVTPLAEILKRRYDDHKPVIIVSNFSLHQVDVRPGLGEVIGDRIIERTGGVEGMLEGSSFYHESSFNFRRGGWRPLPPGSVGHRGQPMTMTEAKRLNAERLKGMGRG